MDKTCKFRIDDSKTVFVTDGKKGETGILRNHKSKDKLFEIPKEMSTLLNLFELDFEKKKDIFIGIIKHDQEKSIMERMYTYSTLKTAAKAYSYNLNCKKLFTEVELDHKCWRFMGIYSKNTPSWILCYLGHMYNDITTISIYDTFGEEGLEYILNLTQMKTIVIQSLFLKRISEMHHLGKIKYLRNLIISDLDLDLINYENQDCEYLENNKFNLINLKNFIEEGNNLLNEIENSENSLIRCKPESIALICFTSGSSGLPKGALLSHRSWTNQGISILETHNLNINHGDTHLSYLPYAHVFEQVLFTISLYLGINIVFYNGDPLKLAMDIKIASPDYFIGVPRVLLRFYDLIMMKLKSFTGFNKLVLALAFREKMNKIKKDKKFDFQIYDKLFFDDIKLMLFGRKKINLIITGSAPIDGKILDIFKVVFGCPVIEAYGMTEFVGGLTYTDPYDSISGHVGVPLTISEYKLIDVPELNYFTNDIHSNSEKFTPRGEILARSKAMFEKYLCLQEETENILDKEGWIHTGDIGEIIEGNRLKIIDRRKNIFKLSQAEYISPEKIENVLKLCPHILQSWVYGKSTENYVVALIVLDPNQTIKLASEIKIQFREQDELLTNRILIQFFKNEVEKVCKNSNLASFEIPKKILLTFDAFTIDNGMLTVTMKAMRANIRKYWENKVAGLYYDTNTS